MSESQSPIITAVERASETNLDILKMLLESGLYDVNETDGGDADPDNAWTALQHTVSSGQLEATKLLIKHDADYKQMYVVSGDNIIHAALQSKGKLPFIKYLIENLPQADVKQMLKQTNKKHQKPIDVIHEKYYRMSKGQLWSTSEGQSLEELAEIFNYIKQFPYY